MRLSVGAIIVGLVTAGISPAVAATPPQARFLEYNLCGNVCWTADKSPTGVDTRGKVSDRVAVILAEVKKYSPDVVFLNESCYSQYRGIRAELVKLGYGATYSSTTTGGQCDNYDTQNGQGFGNALFAKGTVPNVQQVYDLGDSTFSAGGTLRKYQMLCSDISIKGRATKACVTHLYADDFAARDRQAQKVLDKVKAFAATKPTVVAGDFNFTPSESVYNKFTPTFTDTDVADKEFTFPGKKLDYIWTSNKHFTSLNGDVLSRTATDPSDHAFYEGQAAFK